MAESIQKPPMPASDAAVVTLDAYSRAADQYVERRGLGRDLLALTAIILIVALFHIQNPISQHDWQFGRAFRNQSLQVVLTLLFSLVVYYLIVGTRRLHYLAERRPLTGVERAAAAVLIAFFLFAFVAIPLRWNPLAPLVNLDPAVFQERLTGDSPLEPLTLALNLSTLIEWAALLAVLALWQPWTRIPVYYRALQANFAPLLVAAAFLGAWEGLIVIFRVQEFLLPRPSVIAGTLLETYPRLVSAGWVTFQNAFWGFAIGCGLGIVTGIAASRFVSFSRALLPVAIAVNAVPIIALAPIFNNWFGALNPASKIAIVVVLVYFPAMISTVRGLTSVDLLSLELMKSYAAAPAQIFRKLRLPSALPFIFSALKVATTLSMIGAIVSEYFGGSTAGLGYRIRDDAGQFKYPEAWSAIFVASLFGILFYMVVSTVERAFMSWHVSFRER
ncbi:MAG: ABC transporter permease [Anaerolinea sp.]|nr:ABC transporter permease [Anaerolinea sp.]